jgi:hypothetical protein
MERVNSYKSQKITDLFLITKITITSKIFNPRLLKTRSLKPYDLSQYDVAHKPHTRKTLNWQN